MSEVTVITFKKNQKVMIVEVKNCDFQGAQGPFTIKNVDLLFDELTLKETDQVFGIDGTYDIDDKNYLFLTPAKKIVRTK